MKSFALFPLCALFLSAAAICRAGDGPYFVNVASVTGLGGVSAQNVYFSDLDGDGYPDAVLINTQAGHSLSVFMNRPGRNGGRTFLDLTEESGINRSTVSAAPRAADFVSFGDVNNDGCVDIFSGRFSEFEKPKTDPKTEKVIKDEKGNTVYEKADDGLRSEILLNDCSGHFTVLPGSGVDKHAETTAAAEFFDYDGDGVLDLFTGEWYKEYGVSYKSYPSRLYRGLGGGRFEEVTQKAGLMTYETEGSTDSSRPVYGVAHCDYDNDGRQDILVEVYGRQANRLWRNNGDGTFTDVAPATGFDGDGIRHGRYPAGSKRDPEPVWRSHGNTFSAACADYDNDGDMDIFLGEITHSWAGESSDLSSLLENLGPGKGYAFKRHPEAMKRTHAAKNWNQGDMHVTWLDFDNDGLLDLLISSGDYPDGQYLRLFRQVRKGVFEDVTEQAGFNWESSAGISVADYDRDGRLDILAGKSWMRMPADRRQGKVPAPALFRNVSGAGNHWLDVTLRGKGAGGANASGIGARVLLTSGGATQTREIQSSLGNGGQVNSFSAHFGLGKAGKADRLEIRWGGAGGVSVFYDVPADRFAYADEASGELRLLPAAGGTK
jgi:hypothetical protein